MTAQSLATDPTISHASSGGMFLGFGNSFRKEVTEWLRSRKALIVAGVSVLGAVFMTLIPFIAKASGEAEEAGLTSMDPTANVLLALAGQTVGLIAIVATMALLSGERDRGTLGWSLTNPVSPTAIIAAKFVAGMVVFSIAAIVIPLIASVALATVVYGGPPDLMVVGTFGLLFLTVPAFYIALTIGLGTAIKATAGVAGAAFAVMFVPQILGGFIPLVAEISPTSIGLWATAVAKGEPASALTPVSWLVCMIAILVAAKVVFDRQEV